MAAPSVVQNVVSTTTGQVITRSATFSSSVTAGDSIVVEIASRYQVTAVVDNKSNVYTKDHERVYSGINLSVWRSSAVATGGSSFQITVTAGTRAGELSFTAQEVDKNLRVAGTAIGGTGPNNAPGVSFPVSPSESLVIIGFNAGPSSGVITGHPANFQARLTDTTTQLCEIMTRSYSASSTGEVATWSLGIARSWISLAVVYTTSLQAGFTGTPTTGLDPLSVAFTDSSTGSPTTWNWDFGDGSTSTSQNPTHIYTVGGTYTVTLTVTRGGEISTFSRLGYITVNSPTPAPAPPTTPGIPYDRPNVLAFPFMSGTPWQFNTMRPPLLIPPAPPAETTAPRTLLLVPRVLQEQDKLARLERQSQYVSLVFNALARGGLLIRSGPDSFYIRTAGIPAQRAPTETDDVNSGCREGMVWVDQSEDGVAYYCADSTAGAAVWTEFDVVDDEVSGGLTGTF